MTYGINIKKKLINECKIIVSARMNYTLVSGYINIETNEINPEQLQPNLIFPETFKKGKIPDSFYKFNPKNSYILKFDGEITNIFNKRIYII